MSFRPPITTQNSRTRPSPAPPHSSRATNHFSNIYTTPPGARITNVPEYGKVLDLFQARGYSEVDTARVYVGGQQEAFTREAGWNSRGLTLATKVQYPAAPGANVADKVVASVETSLKELGTECVDLLYLHAAVGFVSVCFLLFCVRLAVSGSGVCVCVLAGSEMR